MIVAVAVLLLGLLGVRDGMAESGDIGWDPGNGAGLAEHLWVAGDVTVDGEVLEHGPASIEVDDVSLLARYELGPRFSLFGEFRLDDPVEVVEGEGATSSAVRFVVERLYSEALLTPALTLRAGKIFTPYGLWNEVRRAPLTWTVDRPAITENVYPQHATGLSLLYQTTWQGWSLDATTYGPAQDELVFYQADEDNLNEDGLMFGGRVGAGHAVGPAFAAVGLNALGYRPSGWTGWTTVTGADLEVTAAGHQVSGELTFRLNPDGQLTLQGMYLQDAVALSPFIPLLPEFYGVLRFEQMQPNHGPGAVGGLVGFFWRPIPLLVLKANYLFTSRTLDDLEPGFQASVSVLF